MPWILRLRITKSFRLSKWQSTVTSNCCNLIDCSLSPPPAGPCREYLARYKRPVVCIRLLFWCNYAVCCFPFACKCVLNWNGGARCAKTFDCLLATHTRLETTQSLRDLKLLAVSFQVLFWDKKMVQIFPLFRLKVNLQNSLKHNLTKSDRRKQRVSWQLSNVKQQINMVKHVNINGTS